MSSQTEKAEQANKKLVYETVVDPETGEERKVAIKRQRVISRRRQNFLKILDKQDPKLQGREHRYSELRKKALAGERTRLAKLFGEAEEYEEDVEEKFTWWRDNEENTYFALASKYQSYAAGEQLFYCYGRRTNRFLLENYGFVIPNNKYDSFSFVLRWNE